MNVTVVGPDNVTPIDLGGIPFGATQLTNGSAVVSASAATATLTVTSGRTGYLTGFTVTGLGATVAAMPVVSVTGLVGGTVNFAYPAPIGVGVAGPVMSINFTTPLRGILSTNIVVSVATFGVGNVGASCVAYGYMI